jgi:hypothetical protein
MAAAAPLSIAINMTDLAFWSISDGSVSFLAAESVTYRRSNPFYLFFYSLAGPYPKKEK